MPSIKLVKKIDSGQNLAWSDAPAENRGVEFWEVVDDAGVGHRIRVEFNDTEFKVENNGPTVFAGGRPVVPGFLVDAMIQNGFQEEGETIELNDKFFDDLKMWGFHDLWDRTQLTEEVARREATNYSINEDDHYFATHSSI